MASFTNQVYKSKWRPKFDPVGYKVSPSKKIKLDLLVAFEMATLTCSYIFLMVALLDVCFGQINKSPEFLRNGDMSSFSIREDTPIDTDVYQLRALDPEGSRIVYEMVSDYFKVDSDTGVVKMAKTIDREKQSSIQVVIGATDEKLFGTTPNTVYIKREITILDANDNAPKFLDLPYAFTMDEKTLTGRVIFDGIRITDADSGINAKLILSCVTEISPEACEKFGVSAEHESPGHYKGSIFLKSIIDYEESPIYLMTIEAKDSSKINTLTTRINIVIKINDSQDKPPRFLNGPYFAAISEGTPSGVPILTIRVQDGDSGNPRPLELSISDDRGFFKLTSFTNNKDGVYSGIIETFINPLDREEISMLKNNGQYVFHIKAVELEDEMWTDSVSETTITILVTDINDNLPTMSNNETKILIEIPEDIANGSYLSSLDLWVDDQDLGENGHFILSLDSDDDSKNIFAIETLNPNGFYGRTPVVIKIVNNSLLDYELEQNREFNFQIVATDDLGREGRASIQVSLTDSNDNDPIFEDEKYKLSLEENSLPGTILANITATDDDELDNGRLSYAIQGFGAEWFSVNFSTGQITVSDCGLPTCLDYEKTRRYFLTYAAKDTSGHANIVQLVVDIVDDNDNAPTFTQRQLIRNTQTGIKQFIPPLKVEATDKDSSNNGNNNITYRIIETNSPNDTFEIDSISGQINLLKPLIPINDGSLTIHVEATDSGNPPLTGDAFIIVTMTKNENGQLYFVHPLYNASILETAADRTKVTQVVAVDTAQKNPEIMYRIVSGAMDDFVIDPLHGIVSVAPNTSLDLDNSPEEYTVVVEGIATKGSEIQTATTTVHITVEDVNNKSPSFTQDFYVAHISESAPVGSIVHSVMATDPDKDHLLLYSIMEPVTARDRTGILIVTKDMFDFQNVFHMNASTGEITLKSSLEDSEASVIYLRIKVVDRNVIDVEQEQVATTEMMIYVEEIKELNPMFSPPWTINAPEIVFSIPEEPSITSTLFTLTAKNPAGNGQISFKLLNTSDSSYVNIDENTGAVTLLRRLDFEELQSTKKNIVIIVEAIAEDKHHETTVKRQSNATVTINVQDINDNSPVFANQSYYVSTPESTLNPETIIVLKATDKDQQFSFGDIRYSLNGDGADVFSIDPLTGALTVAKGKFLDRETKITYNLKVTATDNPKGNGNQRRASTLVVVEVLDVNDNAPTFSEPLYQAIIPETVAPGFVIRQVKATDRDAGTSGHLIYSLGTSSQLKQFLKVNETTGMLQVSKALSGKGNSEPYKIIVAATDHGDPPLTTEVHVLLFITDVSGNDGVPSIVRPQPDERITVPENSPSGTFVTQVEAIDPDDSKTDSGRLRYSFLGDGLTDSDQRYFIIDPLKGTITTRSPLDREVQDQYKVVVLVRDLGFPPQQTSRSLTIIVTDEDDHSPQFLRPKNSAPLEMEVEEEVPIGTIIGYVEGTDMDIDDNAIIDYFILGGGNSNNDGLLAINRTEDNRGVIYNTGRLDRELTEFYDLIIQVRRPRIPSMKEGKRLDSSDYRNQEIAINSKYITYDPADLSMVQVKVQVRDIDDNPPIFQRRNSTTGIRTNIVPGTEVFLFKAIDSDATYSHTTYKLKQMVFYSANDNGVGQLVVIGFELDKTSGSLRTSSQMMHYENGHFLLEVEATSNNKTDTAFLTVFVLRGRELLKFVFNKPLAEVRKSLNSFQHELQETIHSALPLTVNLYDSHFGVQEPMTNVSSLCFQFINGDEIMSNVETEALLDLPNRPRLGLVYRNYGVQNVENCALEGRLYTMNWMEISILVIGSLIAILTVICALVICHSHRRYKKKMHRTMYQVIRGAVTSDTNGNGYSTIDRQRIHEWRERSPPIREPTYGISYS